MIWMLVLLVLLVLCSAFFSSAEISYASANKLHIRSAAEAGDRRARGVQWISDHFPRFLSTILVGNNLVNIAFSSVMTLLLKDTLSSGETAAPFVSTAVLLICGEIIPKIVGSSQADRLVYYYILPLRFFMTLFTPVVFVVNAIVEKLSRFWTPEEAEPEVTDDELVTILETIEEEGVFTEQESELIKSAIEFSDVTAVDILIPRVDVAAFNLDDGLQELLDDDDLLSYSRIPVYRETIDNIQGILSTKKLLKAAVAQPPEEISVDDLLSPPVYVHKTRTISSILKEFRKKHLMMAVVVDEFGGTMGILTLEDILEEIVGEINDEYDEEEKNYTRINANTYIFEGKTLLSDFFKILDLDDETFEDVEGDADSLAGLLLEIKGDFPELHERLDYKHFTFEVVELDGHRISKIKVIIHEHVDE